MSGFTLIELLAVLVIVGITLGMASFAAMPGRKLHSDAQRIALLLQLARDEAILRNRPIAIEIDAERYRFLSREANSWKLLTDEILREREFKSFPVSSSISPASHEPAAPLRIVFGSEPVDKPFILNFVTDDEKAAISADGIGHFVAE